MRSFSALTAFGTLLIATCLALSGCGIYDDKGKGYSNQTAPSGSYSPQYQGTWTGPCTHFQNYLFSQMQIDLQASRYVAHVQVYSDESCDASVRQFQLDLSGPASYGRPTPSTEDKGTQLIPVEIKIETIQFTPFTDLAVSLLTPYLSDQEVIQGQPLNVAMNLTHNRNPWFEVGQVIQTHVALQEQNLYFSSPMFVPGYSPYYYTRTNGYYCQPWAAKPYIYRNYCYTRGNGYHGPRPAPYYGRGSYPGHGNGHGHGGGYPPPRHR